VVQGAQHRFERISESCNCVLGSMLAATTVVVGIYMGWSSIHSWVWTSRQFWEYLGLVAAAALYAWLLGKGIEVAWSRVRLLLVLRGLKRRLVAGSSFREPAPYLGRVPRQRAAKTPAVIAEDDVAHDHPTRSSVLSVARRPAVLVHDSADMRRLLIHLFTHWKLPRVVISVEGVATLDVQRAQHRIVRLSEACNCVLAACLAAATILGGVFFVEWTASHSWDWMVPESWGPLGMVPVVALLAALTGWAIEVALTRIKLLLVLRGVRHQLG
jgi:hypothetical protein